MDPLFVAERFVAIARLCNNLERYVLGKCLHLEYLYYRLDNIDAQVVDVKFEVELVLLNEGEVKVLLHLVEQQAAGVDY